MALRTVPQEEVEAQTRHSKSSASERVSHRVSFHLLSRPAEHRSKPGGDKPTEDRPSSDRCSNQLERRSEKADCERDDHRAIVSEPAARVVREMKRFGREFVSRLRTG